MDNTLLLSIITLGTGVIALVVKYSFRSKCSDVRVCWGCCSFKRDIKSEVELENIQIEHGIKQSDEERAIAQL
jgi:hypothetical protein